MRRLTGGVVCGVMAMTVWTGGPAFAADGLDYRGFVKFQSAVASGVDDYWERTFAAADERYRSPSVTFTDRGETTKTDCELSGDPSEVKKASPAFYCLLDEGIYLASGWMYEESYLAHGDFATAVVIAHEFAHHIQALLGLFEGSIKRVELQADCFAGTWAHDAEKQGLLEEGDIEEGTRISFASGDYDVTSPDHHGTPDERTESFLRGFESGDPDDCAPKS